MVCKIALSLSIILAPGLLGAQQLAEDYFHQGAQYYVHGKKKEAETEIFTGLKHFPSDPLLNGLAGLLKKEEEQKQQQQDQKKDQQKQDQDKQQQQQQQNQQQQDQQKENQTKDQKEGQSKPEPK